jgi:hypothetical protein
MLRNCQVKIFKQHSFSFEMTRNFLVRIITGGTNYQKQSKHEYFKKIWENQMKLMKKEQKTFP